MAATIPPPIQHLRTPTLEIAVERHGDPGGFPVVLLHGFPYDPRSYDRVAGPLAASGAFVVVPYLRGYGPTRFRSAETLRSGQQAALATDLRDLIEGLDLMRPIVAGFDWGGRAACVAAMLWPERVGGLVTIGGYNVHDVTAMAGVPEPPDAEARNWYQWYFQNDRGRAGLDRYRRELTRQLWREWSPGWSRDDPDFAATFEASAISFDNPDFVSVVVHSYRVRYGLADGDPAYDESEATIAAQPPITVPTVVIDPTDDPLLPPPTRAEHESRFTRLLDHRRSPVGHNTPHEDPECLVASILDLHRASSPSRAAP